MLATEGKSRVMSPKKSIKLKTRITHLRLYSMAKLPKADSFEYMLAKIRVRVAQIVMINYPHYK
jgi:hypothetical protein